MTPEFVRGLREMAAWILDAPTTAADIDPNLDVARAKSFEVVKETAREIRRRRRSSVH